MFSINVLLITYNQQDVIGRALDSILLQKEFGLHEIVIGDDCSSDNNWQIIQDYVTKYPEYIRAYRNEPNKGIYGNMEHVLSLRGEADLYMELAGDDAICDGYFKAVQQFAEQNKEKIVGKAAVIYGDYKKINPKGEEFVKRNDKIKMPFNAFSLKIRQLINGRSSLVTPQVYDRYKPIDLSNGLCLAEELYDCQKQLCSDINLYIPCVGSIYYSGIGVSTKLNCADYYKERMYKFEHIGEYIKLSGKDSAYMKYRYQYYKFRISRNFRDLLKCRWYHNQSLIIRDFDSLIHGLRETLYMIKFLLSANKFEF